MSLATPPSRKSVQKASKRILKGDSTPSDERILQAHRNHAAEQLGTIFKRLTDFARGIDSLATSRIKRLDAIIRKILRDEMTAESMDDLIGIRFVVDGPETQEQLVDLLKQHQDCVRCKDYRDGGGRAGYRAVHLIFRFNSLDRVLLEVQVRTWAQHLWASLSEALGQRVKEGAGTQQLHHELMKLSALLDKSDASDRLPRYGSKELGQYYLLLVNYRPFQTECLTLGENAEEARSLLDAQEIRLAGAQSGEAVLLMSRSETDLRSTHVRFFPRTLIAQIEDNFGARLSPLLAETFQKVVA